MTPLTTPIPAATRDLGAAEERFFEQHGSAGPRVLYRLVAALS